MRKGLVSNTPTWGKGGGRGADGNVKEDGGDLRAES